MGGTDGIGDRRGLAPSAIGTGWGSTLDLNRRAGPQDAAHVAEQFESILVQQMLESMRAASGDSELFDGPGSELARNLLDETLSASVARAGGLGLAKSLLRSFNGEPPSARNHDESQDTVNAATDPSSSPADMPKTSVPRANVSPEQRFSAAWTVGKDGKSP
ncbi:MAG: rod-binding protein [Deltaproteobacteria bacterium]|jgi:Rod binding domain-containing protein|nr:rod-binding protein [Deltaproteobacteria bacterium]